MILSMSNQAMIFFTTILVGFVIGFIYDLFRVIRKIIKHPNLLIQIEDILYWIFVSIIMFYVMFSKNYGEIRAFSIVGAFLGMIFYFFTISRLFINVSMIIVEFLKKVIMVIIEIVLMPFRLFYKILYAPIMFCKKNVHKNVLLAKKVLHKSKKYVRMKGTKVFHELKIITKKV